MGEKKTKEKRVIYYSDPLNDDFAGTKIDKKVVDEHFKFIHRNPVWKFFALIVYYVLAVPIIWIYEKLFLRVKFVNKKAIKKLKKPAFFFGNHIGAIDAFTPNLMSMPRANKIVVSPETVSVKGIKNLVQMLGAVPIPTNMAGMKKFATAVEYYHKKGNNITIYPEAHIWPYYTGVRPFGESPFGYPITLNSTVIAFFTAFSEPKGFLSKFRKANVTVYISDPIYPDLTKPKKEAKKELRDKVYNFMVECSQKYSTYAVIEYKPIEESPDYNEKNAKYINSTMKM